MDGTKAIFTFFSLSGCGYCKQLLGVNDKGEIDPNSTWNTLSRDPELAAAGVRFWYYQIGKVKDADGKESIRKLHKKFESKGIRGYPHLEMAVPDEDSLKTGADAVPPGNGVDFDGQISSWKTAAPGIKKWILTKLKEEPFKSYAPPSSQPRAAIRPPTVNGNLTRGTKSTQKAQAPGVEFGVQSQDSLLQMGRAIPNQAALGRNPTPTVFGLGTQQVPIIKNTPNGRTLKAPPKFLPANYDN